MLSWAPASLARSTAWRTASAAVSEPSVPTTMRVNTPPPRSVAERAGTGGAGVAGRPRKPSPRISVGVVARRTIAIAIEATRQTTSTTIPTFQRQASAGSLAAWCAVGRMERVADGVWLLRGDLRKSMNIYFLEDGDGVVQFDAGTKAMTKKARAAARAARRAEADRARPRPRRPPRHGALRWARRSTATPTRSPTPKATPRSPPTWTSRSCRWRRRAGSTRSCCGAGTAAR